MQEEKKENISITRDQKVSLLDLIVESQPKVYSLVPEEAYKIAKASEFKVDSNIIDVISQDAEYSFYYALKTDFKNIPKKIIVGISKDPEYSYLFFRRQHAIENKVPKIIMGTIASNKEYVTKANKLVKKINERIKEINSILAVKKTKTKTKTKTKRQFLCWICGSPSCYLSWKE